jgi:ABC-type polysaccharide/polyol phosphate transport system ATPase subunit
VAAPVIELQDVHKRYRIYRQRYQSVKEILVHRRLGEWEDHWALRGVTLDVRPGTTLGLIGPNGAGKSTTLKIMARILTPDRGGVRISRRVSGLLELGAGFQLEYTGRENIYLNASLLGLTRREIDRKYEAIVDFSELGAAIQDPLRTYSSGMYMRLAFSIAVHVDPEVLLVDEILAVGDQSFQQKCLDRIGAFQAAGGTIVIVSHSLSSIQEMCTKVAWIEDGIVQELGPPMTVVNAYLDHVRQIDETREAAKQTDQMRELPAVQLGEVHTLNRHGEPARVLETGDPLVLEIPFCVNRRLNRPVFGVALFRNDGIHLYGTNTRLDRATLPTLTSDGIIRLHFRGLSLLAGTYRLTVGVFDESDESQPLDYHDKRYSFHVISNSDEQGLVRFDHEWQLDTDISKRHVS